MTLVARVRAGGASSSTAQLSPAERRLWEQWQGPQLEPLLASGAVALLDARWLIELGENGGVLRPRQALPEKAFLSLSEVIVASSPRSLAVVCISHCWLQPDHPDPCGHNLHAIVRRLKSMLKSRWYKRGLAVFIDFCCIHQECRGADGVPRDRLLVTAERAVKAVGRTSSEERLYQQALRGLGTLYAHLVTSVWMMTELPPDYDVRMRYPMSKENASYHERGWCFCEATWASMVKNQELTLDLSLDKSEGDVDFNQLVNECQVPRPAPVLPAAMDEALARLFYSNARDKLSLSRLYRQSFATCYGNVMEYNFSWLGWGDVEAIAVADVLIEVRPPELHLVRLGHNRVGDEGARALANALTAYSRSIGLALQHNAVGDDGAFAFAAMLRKTRVRHLNLEGNPISEEAIAALRAADRDGKLRI